MTVEQWIKKEWKVLESISKKILHDRWREGISEYYIFLQKKNIIPPSEKFTYYYMMNLRKSNSAINYIPKALNGVDLDYFELSDEGRTELKVHMMMDLNDEVAVDFLMNNENNERWLKIYNIVYRGGMELDLFEKIIFEYVFLKGMSIREIVSITGNSQDYIYKTRRALIDRIKEELNKK